MFANLALLSVSVTKFCKLLCVMQLRSYGSCQFISVDHLCPQLSWHVTSHDNHCVSVCNNQMSSGGVISCCRLHLLSYGIYH